MRSMARILAGAARVFRTLPGILSWGPAECGTVAVNAMVPVIKRQTMSAAARRRIAAAQRKRWAEIKKAEAAPKTSAGTKEAPDQCSWSEADHCGDEEAVGGIQAEEKRR